MQFRITIACFALHTNDVATGYTNTKHALIASAELAYHPKQQLKRLNILTVSVAVFYKKDFRERTCRRRCNCYDVARNAQNFKSYMRQKFDGAQYRPIFMTTRCMYKTRHQIVKRSTVNTTSVAVAIKLPVVGPTA